MKRRLPTLVAASLALCAIALVAHPGHSQQQNDEPLPERGAVVEIDSPERALYKIAVPNLRGSSMGAAGAQVLRGDFNLVSLFQVLDARSFIANLEQEGLNMVPSAWSV